MIRTTRVLCLLLVASGTVSAQAWSPHPSYATKMGGAPAVDWGHSAASRYQFTDGNFRNQALVLNKLSARPRGGITYVPTIGAGRSWQSVVIDIAPTQLSRVSSTYTQNYSSAPTRVFSGSVTWPSLDGEVVNALTTFPVQIPFQTPFVHVGNSDFLIDVQMAGGTLANGQAWGRANYHLDTYKVANTETGYIHYYHDPAAPGCVDSSLPASAGRAFAKMNIQRYADDNSVPASVRNRVLFGSQAKGLPPRHPFVSATSLAVNPLGLPVPGGCERLFVDLNSFVYYSGGSSGTLGEGWTSYGPSGFLYQPFFFGLEVYTQYAWEDTQSRRLMVSAASSSVVPELFYVNTAQPRRVTVYGSLSRAQGDVTRSSWFSPIFKYN